MARVVCSIEARMQSSRLPGKVLADIAGQPALTRLLTRLQRCRRLDDIVLATSRSPADDVLETWALVHGVRCHRGSEDDVLARVVEAHRIAQSEVIVEVTGDCVLLDPEIVDLAVHTFAENDCDVVSNGSKRGYPNGMDVQVFRFRDLERVETTCADPAVREHVSLHFYEHPEEYRIIHLLPPARWFAPHYRLHLDYAEDLRFLNEVYLRLDREHGDAFGLEEIMAILRREPELLHINIHCVERAARV
jgi:spore coat polysaccharide biosynthesis protein SpsF